MGSSLLLKNQGSRLLMVLELIRSTPEGVLHVIFERLSSVRRSLSPESLECRIPAKDAPQLGALLRVF